MPSHKTSVRLAPEDPRPRSETPCVVGLATRLDERRNRLKPGTERRRSSRLTPGVCCRSEASRVETLAGVSAEIVATTVIDVLTGSGVGGAWGASGEWKHVSSKDARAHPAGFREAARRRGNDNFVAAVFKRRRRSLGAQGIDQGQILQNYIDIAVFRLAEVETLRAEVYGNAPIGEPPRQKRAAIDGALEPGVERERNVTVEEHFDGLFLFAREFADLQGAHVGGGFPIDMAGALQDFVGADAIEVLAQAAVMGLDLAIDPEQEIVEAGVRVQGGVDEGFAAERDARGFFQKPEGKRGGEGETVLAIGPAPGEAHFDGLLQRGVAGDQREIDSGLERGAVRALNGLHTNGERWHQPLLVAHEELAGHVAAGGDVFGNQEIQFEPCQAQPAHETRDQQRGEHGGHNQEQQIVGRREGGEADRQDGQYEEQSGARDLVTNAAGEEASELLPAAAHGVS